MRRVIVGMDGSDASLDALQWALDEAANHPASIVAVHAYHGVATPVAPVADPLGEPVATALVTTEQAEQQARELLHEQLSATALRPGVHLRAEVVAGDAADVLLQASQDADLLVLGTHRHGVLHDLVLGSVSRRCSQRAACPVVLVPHTEPVPSEAAPPLVPLT